MTGCANIDGRFARGLSIVLLGDVVNRVAGQIQWSTIVAREREVDLQCIALIDFNH